MISRVDSFVLQGIDAIPCEIEVDLSPVGLPRTTVVGLADTAVKESVERVRTALLNSGFQYPNSRITINLAPADVRKEGPVYDLPFAAALLRADATIAPLSGDGRPSLDEYLIAGELALDGRIRPIKGAISLAMLARQRGAAGVIVPAGNAAEAAAVDGINVLGVRTLGEVVALFGPTDPGYVGPQNDHSIVVQEKLECVPCYLNRTCSEIDCMRQLGADRVLDACRRLMDG